MRSLSDRKSIPRWLVVLACASLIAGAGLRLFHPGHHIYWHDEVHTALRIFGFSTEELVKTEFDGKLHTAAELQRFQRPDPDKDIMDTLKSLAGHPEHGPLYYLLARGVSPWFDPPLAGARILSGIFGILLIIAVFYLARCLFPDKPASPWIAVIMVSLSPFFILYAREARQYSLWALITAVSMIWFLRFERLGRNWAGFGALLATGMYTHLMFGWLILAFALYLIMDSSYRRYWRNFVKSVLLAMAMFSPWIWVIFNGIRRVDKYTGWMKQTMSLGALFQKWGEHIHHLLFDLQGFPAMELISIPVVATALIWTFWRGNRKATVLLALVMATNILPLVVPDLVYGGQRSTGARYMMSGLLCLELCVIYALACALAGNVWSRLAGKAFLILLFIGTACFGYQYFHQPSWWNKFSSHFNPTAAEMINQSRHPLIITDDFVINPGEALSLSYLVRPDTPFLLVSGNMNFNVPAGYDIFVMNPSWPLLENMKHRCNLVPAKIPGNPWWVCLKN